MFVWGILLTRLLRYLMEFYALDIALIPLHVGFPPGIWASVEVFVSFRTISFSGEVELMGDIILFQRK